MFANLQARTAYGQTSEMLGSFNNIEYKLIAEITADLSRSAQPGAPFAQMAEALQRNTRLWTILAGDVSDPQNKLPQALRAGIFYLFEFTMQHTGRILDGDATVDALIDINRSVLRGLSEKEKS